MLASELIAHVRRLGSIPAATGAGLADADVLAAADMEISATLLPMLRRLNEEYLVRVLDVTSANGRVTLPARAAGAAVRLVQLVQQGGGLRNLPRVSPEDDLNTVSVSTTPSGFYFDGGGIVLVPYGSNGTLRVRYHARPGKLSSATGGVIATVTADSPTVGRTALTFSSVTLANPLDIVAQGPAHEHLMIGATVANLTATGCDVATTSLLGAVSAGDIICTKDTSPFVPVPEEMASALVSLVAARLLRQGGYSQESAQHLDEGRRALGDAESYLRPRSDGNPKRLRGGILGRIASRGWYWK